MKVDELKEELEARGEATSGSKAWLRRRLHAAIVREYLDGAMARRMRESDAQIFRAPAARWLLPFYKGRGFGFI